MEIQRTLFGRRGKPARWLPIAALGAAAALTLTALTITSQTAQATSTQAAAVATVQKAWSYVPEYASSPMIDQGTIRDAAGRPVPGATVIIFPYLINGGKPGSVLQPIARATSDGSGHFAVHLPANRDALLMSRRTNGYLDMHVIVFYPGGTATWFAPMRAGARVAHVNNLMLKDTVEADRAQVAPNAPATCVNSTRTSIANVPVVVGFKGSAAPSIKVGFKVTASATTTMGVGVSGTSEFGGFSASGSTTQSYGADFPWPTLAGVGNNYYTAFALYYDQKIVCSSPLGIEDSWTLTQNSINSEDGTPGAEPISAGHCTTEEPNRTQTYMNGTQSTFSAGADLKLLHFNIDLSTQVGWSQDAYLSFTTGAQALPLCGVNNVPNATDPSAGEITVHA